MNEQKEMGDKEFQQIYLASSKDRSEAYITEVKKSKKRRSQMDMKKGKGIVKDNKNKKIRKVTKVQRIFWIFYRSNKELID